MRYGIQLKNPVDGSVSFVSGIDSQKRLIKSEYRCYFLQSKRFPGLLNARLKRINGCLIRGKE